YPQARLQHMLQDSQAKLVLTQSKLRTQLTSLLSGETELIALDESWSEYDGTEDNLNVAVTPQHLAYVIYTSGSTGQAKGVAIEHNSAVALISWAKSVYSQDSLEGVLAATSMCFDLSIYEIFQTLGNGGKVILVGNILSLPELKSQHDIRLINTVPSAMEELLRLNAIPASVKTINLAGEPLSNRLVDKIYSMTAVEDVYDLYGPSEDTTYSTFTRRVANGQASIGKPIANTQAYIFDEYENLAPKGVMGELYLSGEGLARGYYRREALSAEKFLDNPFYDAQSQHGRRMYKTGDLVRWLDNGELEYLGRIDNQVKIRGFRIEIGEIEAQLGQFANVTDCAVVAKNLEGSQQLIAYYVPANNKTGLDEGELRAHLRRTLPEYMLPAACIRLESIPLMPNGKVDRITLEAMQVNLESSKVYVAPRNEVESQLAVMFAEVLNVNVSKVGSNDNFFELGGHSLLSIRLISLIRTHFDVELPVQAVFSAKTLSELAVAIDEHQGTQVLAPLTVIARTKPHYVTSFAQQRLWFIDQLQAGSAQYNMPMAWQVQGELDLGLIKQVFESILTRHEVLRTVYVDVDGEAMQRIRPMSEI
ncbi:non-ribosomal peptide synthetase, partial [Pseudoalteromonas amylolytica]|uniref:non-ribosomal peptide synthetase n=2 Tax=Pseudoalteromonas TaxID=53246 RepID=UPI00111368C7